MVKIQLILSSLYVLQCGQFIWFSVVSTLLPPSYHGRVWVISVIFLLLTNTIAIEGLTYAYDRRGVLSDVLCV
jgi:hypothetical protein